MFGFTSATMAQGVMENDSYLHERWEQMYSVPGKFTINDEHDVEVVDFERPRDVRVCLNNSQHAVPLEIYYRNKQKIIRSGNCLTIEASEVSLSAADELEDGWSLNGTVEVSS